MHQRDSCLNFRHDEDVEQKGTYKPATVGCEVAAYNAFGTDKSVFFVGQQIN